MNVQLVAVILVISQMALTFVRNSRLIGGQSFPLTNVAIVSTQFVCLRTLLESVSLSYGVKFLPFLFRQRAFHQAFFIEAKWSFRDSC